MNIQNTISELNKIQHLINTPEDVKITASRLLGEIVRILSLDHNCKTLENNYDCMTALNYAISEVIKKDRLKHININLSEYEII